MQRIFIDNHDRILYYSNPAGYIAEKEAVVDTMFQTQELERFLQKQSLSSQISLTFRSNRLKIFSSWKQDLTNEKMKVFTEHLLRIFRLRIHAISLF